MVDVQKLRARMVLKGFNQKSLVNEMNERGYKISENTFSAKMNRVSPFDCDLVDMLCDVLEVTEPSEKADIFLA